MKKTEAGMDRALEDQKKEIIVPDFVIITGLSGAGRTKAANCFEDMDYFVVDNIPPALIPKFAELTRETAGAISKVALVIDIRGRAFFEEVGNALQELEKLGVRYTILFLEASNDTLVKRFSETRRRHPLADRFKLTLIDAIKEERRYLEEIRARAHIIINTSNLSIWDLKARIKEAFEDEGGRQKGLTINVVSFGYKYGLPLDADLVFDVRFLPNPHYVERIKKFTGKDEAIQNYIFMYDISNEFYEKFEQFIDFLLPQYIREGKSHLEIAIGCTGGKHRSVAIAERLGSRLAEKNYRTLVKHRDL